MKRYLIFFLSVFITLNIAFLKYMEAQIITIPSGTAPAIDGTIKSNEWKDCGSVILPLPGGSTVVKVLYKYDGSNLFFCFQGNLQSGGFQFPELAFDVNNDKSADWKSDDWWFHVSATDCEYNGEHSNYSTCAETKQSWTAARNFTQTGPPVDTVEISIPFATIGFDPNTMDTLGISIMLNDFVAWKYWPSTAHIDTPVSWGSAVFEPITGINNLTIFEEKPFIYPNPTNGSFTVVGDLKGRVEIRNLLGEIVYSLPDCKAEKQFIDLPENLPNGLYVISTENESDRISKPFILRK